MVLAELGCANYWWHILMPTSDCHGPNHTSERHEHCLFTGTGERPEHKNWIQWAEELAGHFLSHWGLCNVKTCWCLLYGLMEKVRGSDSHVQGISPISSFVYLPIWQVYMAYLVKARYFCRSWDHRNHQKLEKQPIFQWRIKTKSLAWVGHPEVWPGSPSLVPAHKLVNVFLWTSWKLAGQDENSELEKK